MESPDDHGRLFELGQRPLLLLLRCLRENLPETEGLIAGSSDNCLSIWRHRQVKHTEVMPGQCGQASHARILPNDYGIVGIAMCAYQLIHILTEDQVADLGLGREAAQLHSLECVPEPDASISSTST